LFIYTFIHGKLRIEVDSATASTTGKLSLLQLQETLQILCLPYSYV